MEHASATRQDGAELATVASLILPLEKSLGLNQATMLLMATLIRRAASGFGCAVLGRRLEAANVNTRSGGK